MNSHGVPRSRRLRSRLHVGRESELAILELLVARAASGHGTLVVVRGESGVGKSRLLAECAQQARSAGALTMMGRAVEGGGPFRPLSDALLTQMRHAQLPDAASLGPFAGPLARLIPGWSREPAMQDWVPDLPLLISEGLLRLLRILGDNGGVVLALDDLQWCDVDTMSVLHRVAHAVEDTPALIIAAARDDQLAGLDQLATMPGAQSLHLGRLSDDEVLMLAASCGDNAPLPEKVVNYLVQNADGLPFLIEELLGALTDSGAMVRTAAGWDVTREIRGAVPASIAAAVRERMETLDPSTRTVVEAAAVIGRQVDWRLLPAITELPDSAVLDALRVAVDRQLFIYDDEHPDVIRFFHALTRDAVVDRVLPPVRATLARRAATTLDAENRDRELAAELHALAGDSRRAAAVFREAAQAAGAALGTREQLLRRSSELAEDDDTAIALAEVLGLAGKAAAAREVGNDLLQHLAATDPRRRALALMMARASVVANRWTEAEQYLAEAGSGPDVDALAAHVALGQQLPDRAETLARSALAAAPSSVVVCEALEIVGRCARLRGRLDDAEAAFTRALQVAQTSDLRAWQVRALNELGTLDLLGPARVDRLEKARELAVAAGLLSTAALVDLQLAGCHGMLVDYDATLTAALRCEELALALRLPVLAGAARVFTAMMRGHTGQLDEMDADLELAVARINGDSNLLALVTFVRGVPAIISADLSRLWPHLEEGMRLVRANPAASPSPFQGLYALVATLTGDGDAAREELRRSGAAMQSANRAALAYADAVAAGRAGADPTQLLDEAESAMAPLIWRRHHARLLIAPAALRDGWGQPLQWLREANAHFEAVGPSSLAKACREQMRAAGVPVPRLGRGDGPVPDRLRALGVTSRETEVLFLVADGLPNAAIAERLHLSPRTVETHITNLLAKTGVRGRKALASLASDQPNGPSSGRPAR